ncbi:MAG: acyl-CoA dehydrogenase family protein [Pseudomonadota bacterium]
MDFEDTPEEARFRKEVREWLRQNKPQDWRSRFNDYVQDIEVCKAWQKKKADAGWSCMMWPKEFGCRGATPLEQIIWNQEEGDIAELSTPFIIGHGMAGQTIITHGTESQKKRFLPPLISGEEVWCQLFSEPSAGSDLAGLRTKAVRDGDEWVVTGQKIWTSLAHIADFGILVTRTDTSVPKHRGLTYFILDMKSPGVEVRPIKQASGASDFNEVFLTDVRIPDSNRLDEVGRGWQVAMTTLMNERLSVGAAFPTNVEDILDLANQVHLETGLAVDDAAVRSDIADWYVKASGLKYGGFRTLSALSRGQAPGPEASITKLVLGTGRQDLANFAMDLMDQAGIVSDGDLAPLGGDFQKIFMRSIGNRLEGGTDEILRNIIAERVLGLPQDIRVDKDVAFSEIPTGTA